MKLFEASWKENYEYYERVYDTDTKQSQVNKIQTQQEWYEEYSQGNYTSILDSNIKLKRCQGKSKDAREQWGYIDPIYRNIRDNYWSKAYNKDPRIFYLDIETRVGTNSTGFPKPDKSLEPVSLIQIYDNHSNSVILIGLRDWKHKDDYKYDYDVKYIKANDEIHLFQLYFQIFKQLNPLIVYAWNGNGFDYPYLYNRAKLLGLDTNQFSNYGNVKLKEREYQGMTEWKLETDGHYHLDLKDIYKNFVFQMRPSYGLDVIAEIELGERKVPHTEYEGFDDFYTGNYNIPKNPTEEQKNSRIYQEAIKGNFDEVKELAHSDFVHYGIIDTYLIKRLDDKKNFTKLQIMITETMGVLLSDALGTVKPWSQYIQNKAHLDKQVLPKRQEFDPPDIVGGYVRTPQIGKHNWVLSADVNSMYPLLGMVGFNMSPETFIPKYKLSPELRGIVLKYFNDQNDENRLKISDNEWDVIKTVLKRDKVSLGINGAVFGHEKLGMVPIMVHDIYGKRKAEKKLMFKYEQRKILINEILKERNKG